MHPQVYDSQFAIYHVAEQMSSPSLRAELEKSWKEPSVVLVLHHQMDTRRRCDDGLVTCTQSVLYLSRTPVRGLSDHNLMFTSLPRHTPDRLALALELAPGTWHLPASSRHHVSETCARYLAVDLSV